MKLGRALGCAILLAATAACGQADPESLGQASQEIYQGYPSGPEDDGVVKVANVDTNGVTNFCTGTLVAPNVVLTARHCVSNISAGQFTCTETGELTPDSEGGRFGALLEPGSLQIFAGAAFKEPLAALGRKVFATQTPSICRNDLAVVVLDREISGAPLVPIRLDRGNQRGEVLRVVGFGETEDAMRGVRRAKDALSINQVGSSKFLVDGDPIPPRTFLTVGPALCIGDSGGPALTSEGAVTGVYSQLVETCSSPHARQYFTQVAPFVSEVLAPAFEFAGYEPIPENAPSNEAGTGGDSSAAGGAESGGGPSTSVGGGGNGNAGSAELPPPPEKGGCVCSMTSSRGAGSRLTALLVLGAVGLSVSRRRGRGGERRQ